MSLVLLWSLDVGAWSFVTALLKTKTEIRHRDDFFRFISRAQRPISVMALVRILVDGYSLLHSWPELAPGKPRHSVAAREELIRRLSLYRDTTGTPITVFFDGSGAVVGKSTLESRPELEILYSRAGQTADDMIERTAYRMKSYGEALVVTDDYAERDTVISLGGMASSCLNFIQTVENTLAEQAEEIKHLNRQERNRFNRRR